MRYMTFISHSMQKHKFSITGPDAFFVETVPGPLEHEKECVGISRSGYTGIHCVTHKSQWMQKHKFGVTCHGAVFVKSVFVPPEHEK
jgi:hypothetical protein